MTGLENRVMIEVEAFPETTTIVVKGELDLVTRPYLAAQLVLAVQDRPGHPESLLRSAIGDDTSSNETTVFGKSVKGVQGPDSIVLCQ